MNSTVPNCVRTVGRLVQCGVVLVALSGCRSWFKANESVPLHPMFAYRRPIEAKPEQTTPTKLPFSEPAPPQNPYFSEETERLVRPSPRPIPAILTNTSAAATK